MRDTTVLKAEHKATERNPKSVGSRLVSFASNKFSYLLQLPYSRYYDSLETEIFTLENQDHVSSLVWLQILWIAKELFLRGRNRERVSPSFIIPENVYLALSTNDVTTFWSLL